MSTHPDPENIPVKEVHGIGGPLSSDEVPGLRNKYGRNSVVTEKKIPAYMILLQALFHPFNILLSVIAISSAVADELATTVIISVMIIISSSLRFYQEWKTEGAVHGLLKLITKSVAVIRFDTLDPEPKEMMVPSEELVPGDWVVLRPGELVPADGIVISSKVFFISQSALTGEAIPVEKYEIPRQDTSTCAQYDEESRKASDAIKARRVSIHKPMSKVKRFFRMIFGMKVSTDSQLDKHGFQLKEDLSCPDHVFMGTQVITGMATVRIIRTGSSTLFGRMAEALSKAQPTNPFQQGVKKISWIFFLTMVVMVPPVFIIHGVFHFDWKEAFIFSLSVAVGLTPEMLPMIVNANLAKGSLEMSKKSSIIKKLDAIINMGAVDVLCTDKTGTLTKSIVQLKSHVDPYGHECFLPLRIGYLNSYFQSVLQNPLDSAVTAYYSKLGAKASSKTVTGSISSDCEDGGCKPKLKSVPSSRTSIFVKRYSRVDELPFDFTRRRLSVILKASATDDEDQKVFLVCKGAVEETLAVCTKTISTNLLVGTAEAFPPNSAIIPLSEGILTQAMHLYNTYTQEGQRVLAVAYKPMPTGTTLAKSADEGNLIFVGFLAFVDPPKETAKEAVQEIIRHNIQIKVLTGDAPNICYSVCKEIKLPVKTVVTGEDLEKAIEAGNLGQVVEDGTIFAKLTPLQKSLVVQALKEQNHVVAFMGDGINDAPALKEADVGISVDNGVDICRESADVILLDKDLKIVVDGIRIGRETYGNTLKYITMAVSSNFGNVFSVLVASAWLPFEPMQSLHLLTQNLLYDCSQIGIPWDSVDEDFLLVPHKWKMKSILRFMLWMGPWSSVFDISTFAFMYYYYDIKTRDDPEKVKLFQTTWFTVGLLTQTLIVHMIRTAKIPIIQSRASWPLTLLTLLIMGIGLALPHIPRLNDTLELYHGLPLEVYYFTAAVLATYCIFANVAKLIYVAIFKEWF